jgi:hypothetical protein
MTRSLTNPDLEKRRLRVKPRMTIKQLQVVVSNSVEKRLNSTSKPYSSDIL